VSFFSVLIEGLRKRFRRDQPDDSEYRVFTTRFDEIVEAERLDTILGPMTSAERIAFEQACHVFESELAGWKTQAQLAFLPKVKAVKSALAKKDAVVSILLDHSGSMKGGRILLAAAAMEVAADFLSQVGVRYELLGFTTKSWWGGESRLTWKLAREPYAPGRLCDLLHIIYRDADASPPGAPWSIRQMLRPSLLKENIDGEALAWAMHRLAERPESIKCIIVVSDGAPVDDSTLSANHPTILEDHLLQTIDRSASEYGIKVGGLGIGYSVARYYPLSASVEAPEDLGTALVSLITEMLTKEPTVH
jgi:cobaltochelatase CobT